MRKKTSPKSKGEKIQQTNSPQKNPKRIYLSKKNASPKAEGETFQQTNSPQKNPKRKCLSKKNYLTKIKNNKEKNLIKFDQI